jgi:hypothetical protein
MEKNKMNSESQACEVDGLATFHVLLHSEVRKNIMFPYSVNHLRWVYIMCNSLNGEKTTKIAREITELMEYR